MAKGFSSCGAAVISTVMTQNRSDGGDKLYPESFSLVLCVMWENNWHYSSTCPDRLNAM